MQMRVTAGKGKARGILAVNGEPIMCALGPAGIVAAKREGDGGTPLGVMALGTVYYRPDRVARPQTGLPVEELRPDMGWCDDPASPAYNAPVTLPLDASHETMWREDHAYDICVVLDWNLSPAVSGRGSAIFFHLAKDGYPPTEGCIAVSLEDMCRILKECGPGSAMETVVEG